MIRFAVTTVALLGLASVAHAADLPASRSLATAPKASPVWTGLYVGLNAGGSWNNIELDTLTRSLDSDASDANLVSADLLSGHDSLGLGGNYGGGQIGYNWEFEGGDLGSGLIVGLEADFDGTAGSDVSTNRKASATTSSDTEPVFLISNQKTESNLQYLGTIRGRLGILVDPELLLYGTAGLTYGNVSSSLKNDQSWTTEDCGCDYLISGGDKSSNVRMGWTVGGGLEWALRANWSLKAEYLHYDLGEENVSMLNTYEGINEALGDSGNQSKTHYSIHLSGNVVRAGINYHF